MVSLAESEPSDETVTICLVAFCDSAFLVKPVFLASVAAGLMPRGSEHPSELRRESCDGPALAGRLTIFDFGMDRWISALSFGSHAAA